MSGEFAHGTGLSRTAFPVAWAYERMYELSQHTQNVHAPDVVEERRRREVANRVAMMREQMGLRPTPRSGSQP